MAARGTVISDAQTDVDRTGPVLVKGFATIDNVALINVEGTGMVGHHTLLYRRQDRDMAFQKLKVMSAVAIVAITSVKGTATCTCHLPP